jgi:hypothetical protein
MPSARQQELSYSYGSSPPINPELEASFLQ